MKRVDGEQPANLSDGSGALVELQANPHSAGRTLAAGATLHCS